MGGHLMGATMEVPCDYCEGKGLCPICKGSGSMVGNMICSNCPGNGICIRCKGRKTTTVAAPRAPRAPRQPAYDDSQYYAPGEGIIATLMNPRFWLGLAVVFCVNCWWGVLLIAHDAAGTWWASLPLLVAFAAVPLLVRIPRALRTPEVWIKGMLIGIVSLNIASLWWLIFSGRRDVAGVSAVERRAARSRRH